MSNKSIGLSQMAEQWGMGPELLRSYINRIGKDVPLYKPTQRLFVPCQYKKIAELLGFDI